jgi:fatty acid synthase subunit alpha, fungi type/fatty acid synthase subunit beta, fungi type
MTEMMTSNSLVKIKEHPPYTPDLETPVLLNPLARTQLDKLGSYSYPKKLPSVRVLDDANVKAVSTLLDSQRGTAGIGVDQGM